jgi:hypothetical protein
MMPKFVEIPVATRGVSPVNKQSPVAGTPPQRDRWSSNPQVCKLCRPFLRIRRKLKTGVYVNYGVKEKACYINF